MISFFVEPMCIFGTYRGLCRSNMQDIFDFFVGQICICGHTALLYRKNLYLVGYVGFLVLVGQIWFSGTYLPYLRDKSGVFGTYLDSVYKTCLGLYSIHRVFQDTSMFCRTFVDVEYCQPAYTLQKREVLASVGVALVLLQDTSQFTRICSLYVSDNVTK